MTALTAFTPMHLTGRVRYSGWRLRRNTPRRPCAFLFSLLFLGSCQASVESGRPPGTLRCGWFDNPTPANASLTDRHAEWTISQQGGHQAVGGWPLFAARDWVRTGHGSHGYGCACLKVSTDDSEQIVQIFSARSRPLSACRQDPALKGKEPENPLVPARAAGS